MDYTSLQNFKSPEEQMKRQYPLIKEVQIPTFQQFIKEDLAFNLAAGLIFGIGHFIGAFLMKRALG